MKLVYICSPYRGKIGNRYIENSLKAIKYCKIIAAEGDIPFASHVYFPKLLCYDHSNPAEMERAMKMGIEVLHKCDKLVVFGNIITEGMQSEIEFAMTHNIPIERRKLVRKEKESR